MITNKKSETRTASWIGRNGSRWSSAARLCLLALPLACGDHDGWSAGEASSEESQDIDDGEAFGDLEQALSGGTLVSDADNVAGKFGAAVKMDGGAPCSGVKIGPNKFLTAGHCFSDTRTSIRITNRLDGVFPSTSFTIRKNQQHPSHKIGSTGNATFVENGLYDLKIIEINEATDSIPVAKITVLAASVGTTGLISVGYGCDDSPANNDGKKQRATFTAVQGAASAHVRYISENSSVVLCGGDSGGPLFRLVNGEYQVTGINAGAAVFTRIENTAPWIGDPVVNVFTNNSVGQFMNMASSSTTAFPPLNCAAMMGSGTHDVRLDQCDGQAALYNGFHSVTWAPIAGNTGAGFQKIINFSNGNCLTVENASTGDANVVSAPCVASTATLNQRRSQAWRFVNAGAAAPASVGTPAIDAFNVINELGGRCLSTTASTAAGVNSDVRVTTCSNVRRDQRWVFTR